VMAVLSVYRLVVVFVDVAGRNVNGY
jgi:hypothetical protein